MWKNLRRGFLLLVALFWCLQYLTYFVIERSGSASDAAVLALISATGAVFWILPVTIFFSGVMNFLICRAKFAPKAGTLDFTEVLWPVTAALCSAGLAVFLLAGALSLVPNGGQLIYSVPFRKAVFITPVLWSIIRISVAALGSRSV